MSLFHRRGFQIQSRYRSVLLRERGCSNGRVPVQITARCMPVLPSQQHSQKRDCRCGRSGNVRVNVVLNREQPVPSLASFSISFSHAAPFETKHVLCNRLWNEPRGLAVGFDDDIYGRSSIIFMFVRFPELSSSASTIHSSAYVTVLCCLSRPSQLLSCSGGALTRPPIWRDHVIT